jgi:hypothetical protein
MSIAFSNSLTFRSADKYPCRTLFSVTLEGCKLGLRGAMNVLAIRDHYKKVQRGIVYDRYEE